VGKGRLGLGGMGFRGLRNLESKVRDMKVKWQNFVKWFRI
jgi:hypothetical protein